LWRAVDVSIQWEDASPFLVQRARFMHLTLDQIAAFLAHDEKESTIHGRLVELLKKHDRTLTDYRICGELLMALRPAEAHYGSGWVQAICEVLSQAEVSLSRSLAYRLIRFAELYPGTAGKTQVKKLDRDVSWESMMRILSIDDAEKRSEILNLASERKLSSRQVIALIREKTGYRRARGGRTKDKPSSHPNLALKNLRVVSSKWLEVCASWSGVGNNALLRAARLTPAKLTDAFLDDLRKVVSLVKEIATAAGPLAKEMSSLHVALNEKRNKSS